MVIALADWILFLLQGIKKEDDDGAGPSHVDDTGPHEEHTPKRCVYI